MGKIGKESIFNLQQDLISLSKNISEKLLGHPPGGEADEELEAVILAELRRRVVDPGDHGDEVAHGPEGSSGAGVPGDAREVLPFELLAKGAFELLLDALYAMTKIHV